MTLYFYLYCFLSFRSSFKSLGDEKPVKSVKSDFFDGNSPLRKKTKQFANPLLSDDEVCFIFSLYFYYFLSTDFD